MQVTELEWTVFSLIGVDIPTRDIAKLLRCKVERVWRIRGWLGKKLGLRGNRLVVTAVKCVWMQEHDQAHPHISIVFTQFSKQQKLK